jgi:hypothetical protein
MRQSPSTSTRTVPSGNFTILFSRETQPTFVQILRAGFGDFGIGLQHGSKKPVAGHEVVHEFKARSGLNEQRHDGAGKNHDVRQAEDGQVSGSERDETRPALPLFRLEPRMLTNSVSGDFIVVC